MTSSRVVILLILVYYNLDKNISILQSFGISFFSSTFAALATNPLDVIKVRMQVDRAENAHPTSSISTKKRYGYRNLFHGIFTMVKEEGFQGLFRGSSSRVVGIALNSGVYLTLLDYLRQKFVNNMK